MGVHNKAYGVLTLCGHNTKLSALVVSNRDTIAPPTGLDRDGNVLKRKYGYAWFCRHRIKASIMSESPRLANGCVHCD